MLDRENILVQPGSYIVQIDDLTSSNIDIIAVVPSMLSDYAAELRLCHSTDATCFMTIHAQVGHFDAECPRSRQECCTENATTASSETAKPI